MADEYWGVWRRIMSGETVDFDGKYIKLKNARLALTAVQQPYPELYFGGSSPAAQQVAAKHADTYLTWGEPPPLAAEKVATVSALAATHGRKLRYGLRIYTIVRETKEEAWAYAQWLYDHMDQESIARNQNQAASSDSVGQQRVNSIIGNRFKTTKNARDLEIYPDIWSGIGLIRGGLSLAIVGDPETVAARIHEYEEIGFKVFILSGYPLIEEAYYVADLLFPILQPAGWKGRAASNLIDLNKIQRPLKLASGG
jgi:alkanesulfonate monooxygenase